MDDLNIIDQFTQTFVTYIDSGFGLLSPDVSFLTSTLVAIDIILAGLFWSLSHEDNVVGQLIRKILYVGFFAFLLNNFASLSSIIFNSFASLGLKASGATLTATDLMRPGFVAGTGFTASQPLLDQAGSLMGFTSFFDNVVTIVVLLLAWIIVLLAFFVLSVQLFITILEFKLTTLAGFILVPFALFGKTSFLAERVLGNVMTSGIKLMVLAIVVGIGSTLFGTLTAAPTGDITLEQAAAHILAAIAVFGLAIFCTGHCRWSDLRCATTGGRFCRRHCRRSCCCGCCRSCRCRSLGPRCRCRSGPCCHFSSLIVGCCSGRVQGRWDGWRIECHRGPAPEGCCRQSIGTRTRCLPGRVCLRLQGGRWGNTSGGRCGCGPWPFLHIIRTGLGQALAPPRTDDPRRNRCQPVHSRRRPGCGKRRARSRSRQMI